MRVFRRKNTASQPRNLLRQLGRALDREFGRNTRALRNLLKLCEDETALLAAIKQIQQVREQIEALRGEPDCASSRIRECLSNMTEEVLGSLQAQPQDEHDARQALARCITLLIAASRAVGARSRPQVEVIQRKVIISADLLLQAHFTVLPPERMLVGAGRTTGDESVLHSLFDVTGAHHSSHVRSDPERLARALITMERSRSFLLAWLHSHPGRGAAATFPSAIDFRQHDDWIRDYSENLLSVILTADGHIRFWGKALESGRIEPQVTGRGVARTEDPNVYRIEQ